MFPNTFNKQCNFIFILDGPRNTTIVVIPSNTVNEGESVTLICSTDGSPPPKISWKKQLASGGPQILCEDTSFTIKNVRADDMGHYECEGVNLAGKDKKAVELIVQGKYSFIVNLLNS